MTEQRFRRELGALAALSGFTAEFLAAHGIDPDHAFEVDLVVEELFSNAVRHNIGAEELVLGLDWEPPILTLVLRDFESRPFDPTTVPAPDLDAPIEERSGGGLGLHFVRRIAQSVKYEDVDGTGTVTVTMRLES